MMYYDIVAEYGREFADDAESVMVDMSRYTEHLNFKNFYGKTLEEFISIFSNYGGMIYSREEYLWRLSYLLSGKYSRSGLGIYRVAPTIDEGVYLDNYLRLSKLQNEESKNGFFELDGELVPMSIQGIMNKSLKGLITEKMYSVVEDLFLLYVVEEEVNPAHDDWDDFIKRLKFSHQKENFNLASMLGAFALCTEYGWHTIYWRSWEKDEVLWTYHSLKSKTKRDRRLTNLFLVHYGHLDDSPYIVMWKCAR